MQTDKDTPRTDQAMCANGNREFNLMYLSQDLERALAAAERLIADHEAMTQQVWIDKGIDSLQIQLGEQYARADAAEAKLAHAKEVIAELVQTWEAPDDEGFCTRAMPAARAFIDGKG